MKGYSEKNVFTKKAKHCLKIANDIIEYMGNGYNKIRCHELARVCYKIIKENRYPEIVIVDGLYGAVDHSWLIIDNVILDVYVIGRLPQTQLVSPSIPGIRFDQTYKERAERTDIDEKLINRIVKKVIAQDEERSYILSL